MISWIFLIVAIVFLSFGVGTGISTYAWLKEARSVEGTVVDLVRKESKSKNRTKTTYAPRVQYTIDGAQREFVSSQSSSPPSFKIGESVRVASNPGTNKECIATFGELYGFSIVGTLVGLAISVATVCLINGDKLLKILHPNI